VYSIAPVSGATSYTWTVPAGSTITSGQGTNSATVTFGSTSGNITVTASNSCGTSSAATFAVTLNSAAPSTPGAISGPLNVCESSSSNSYSIAPVSGATSYTWTVPAGATITSGQGTTTITLSAGSLGGTVSVTASSTCGTSGSSTFTMTVDPLPTMTDPADQTVCSGSATNLVSFTGSASSTYDWTNDNAGTGLAVSGSGDIASFTAANAGVSTITVTPTVNGCAGSPQTFTITVNALPTVAQTSYSTVCDTDPAFALSGGTPAGGVYSGTGVVGANFDPAVSGAGTFTITYTVTQAGCSNSATSSITVDACAGVGEVYENIFLVYPNPVENTLTVSGEGLAKVEVIELHDAAGRLVKKWHIKNTSSDLKLDLTHFASGSYTLRLKGQGIDVIRKIGKE
jgi:hypothetical protein